ncbi:hypothetical protein BD324DRAFT_591650 [Kockovaella imperatae]|uniref:[histone H3]-trimethyl-L-lysine(9) demethylase n=1 Tax=Kockovaella imperatae TaxID=4999 RepID=A0A1Y1UFS8_9TREE|nr:hypothetical protein BD324DRAFT_591650 [Kockovaella imperatae]ORX36366.1 hypothetical protein BD324DRAFT_591650 [Kockovaella imperatae]
MSATTMRAAPPPPLVLHPTHHDGSGIAAAAVTSTNVVDPSPSRSPLRTTRSSGLPGSPSTPQTPRTPKTPTAPANAIAADGSPAYSPKTSARLREKQAARAASATAVATEQQEPVAGSSKSKAPASPAIPSPEKEKYIQPSEFYPLNNNSNTSASRTAESATALNRSADLSPEDDKLATRGIPIFRPTLEEFKDFEAYVTKTVPWGQYSGIVKIVPPAEWKDSLPPIPSRALADVRIKNPIQQNMLGRSGLFRQTNVEKNKNRPLTIQEWFEKCNQGKFAGPGPKDFDRTLDRDSAAAKKAREEAAAEIRRKRELAKEKRTAAAKRKAEKLEQREMTDDEREESAFNGDFEMNRLTPQRRQDSVPPLEHSRHSSHSSPDPIAKTPETISESQSEGVPPWYENFHPDSDWLPKETRSEDYTPEACASLERRFWKNMGLGEPSWYGADLQGTLFPDPKTPWNVAHLPNLLNRLGRELPGVNRPYLYFGMWRAAFAWHVEDMDLFSINYIHFGAPKFWYAIPQGHAEHFERTIGGYFPQEAAECDQFLRHKSYIMSPTRLAQDGIRVNMMVHNQGEFVITFPRGYHAGFNLGFNCAESVNFALESWVDLGRRAKVCQCVSHSVRIDMDELLGQQKSRMQTEQELIRAFEEEKTEQGTKRSYKKRSRPSIAEEEDGTPAAPDFPVNGMAEKKPVIPLQKKPRASVVSSPTYYPCILCPGTDKVDLIPVFEPSEHVKNMCKSEDGSVKAHGACVNSTPEVWIEDHELDGHAQAVVMGVDGILKDRWNLKCQSCKDKKLAQTGAKIQCVNGKCPKAFHVTCARDDEQVVYRVWEVEESVPIPIPENAPPGTQHEFFKRKSLRTEVLCPSHNPDVKEAKKRAQAEQLKQKILKLIPGQAIKVKTPAGLFEVKFLHAHEHDRTADVQHETGQVHRVKWLDFDFRPGPVPLAENEYARHHTHTRRSHDGGVVPQRPPTIRSAAPAASQNGATPTQGPRPPITTSVAPNNEHQAQIAIPTTNMPLDYRPLAGPSSVQRPGCGMLVDPKSRRSLGPTPVVPERPSPLSVQQMLNEPINYHDPRQIPSRVVICDSDYMSPPAPLPYHNGMSQSMTTHPYGAISAPQTAYGYTAAYMGITMPSAPRYPPGYMAQAVDYASAPRISPPVHGYSQRPTIPTAPVGQPPAFRHYSTGRSQPNNNSLASGSSLNTAPRLTPAAAPRPAEIQGKSSKIDLGLERIRGLMSNLSPIKTPAIHLAGTNGKGSVSAMLESCLRAAGLSVARYNSPHLIEARRAIAINGLPPSRDVYDAAVKRVESINLQAGIHATLFELATAAAYAIIDEYKPDIMIIECGMGGETDATNVIPPEMILASGLTAVGLDHTEFLGDTVEKITAVKAGIAVSGGLLVVAPQRFQGVMPVAQRVAEIKGARLVRALKSELVNPLARPKVSLEAFTAPPRMPIRTPINGSVFESHLSLAGAHQMDNASLALNILQAIRSDSRAMGIQPKLNQLTEEALRQGLANAQWAGRCSWVRYPNAAGLPLLVDGAHNADSAKTLRAYVDSLDLGSEAWRTTWIISVSDSKGKSPRSVLEPLLRRGDRVILTTFATPVDGMPWIKPVLPDSMMSIAQDLVGSEGQILVSADVKEALSKLLEKDGVERRGLTVLGGSLYLVSDLYKLLEENRSG